MGKPVLDRFLGAALFALSLIPMLIIAVLVWVRVGRPVLFRQERVGLDGVTFPLFKFRTMSHDRRVANLDFAGEDRRVVHKSENDPRVTSLGRVLRAWSLDELPQFLNVLLGHMSLVGPRPEMPEIVAQYEPWQHDRHQVKPGVTGPWQVSDRSRLLRDCTDLDIEYINELSFTGDLAILLKTPVALVKRKGH